MRTDQETTIKDDEGTEHRYHTVMFGASDGFTLKMRLGKILGVGLGGALEFTIGSGSLDSGHISQAGPAIFNQILAEGGPAFLRELFRHTSRGGAKLSEKTAFDVAYQGNYGEMYEALLWVLKVNFGGMTGRLPFDPKSLLKMKTKDS